ncbi:hypothetical protein ACFC3F_11740 [Microbacterium sp. NPDC055910]|uniref:hypothetical protein n=1 Tax=Microbacterium sp. NPDC055910 TaxID=3345659 RepID=UPI0035E0D4CE
MSGTPPRRRHSPAVYRRRRLVLVLALLVVAAVVWLLIAQPWRSNATVPAQSSATQHAPDAATELPIPNASSQEATGESTPSATESAGTTTPAGAPACLKDDITVEALADQDSYGSGQDPELSIRLTNTGEVDCALNVGTSTQVFTVSSGSDVWWRSTDCQSEPSDMVVLLAAGQSVTSAAPIVWDRTRSAVGTCDDAQREVAPGGGASYHLAVEIGGISSSQSKQLLLY